MSSYDLPPGFSRPQRCSYRRRRANMIAGRLGNAVLFILTLLVVAWPAAAATDYVPRLRVGGGPVLQHSLAIAPDADIAVVRTDIHLLRAATGSGAVDQVELAWSRNGCAGAVKVKFFRRDGEMLQLSAERGPFDLSSSTRCSEPPYEPLRHCIALDPPVDVREGDLVGLARVADCGSPLVNVGSVAEEAEGYLQYAGDVTGSVAISDGVPQRGYLGVRVEGRVSEMTAAVLPVVASTIGGWGSSWKTAVQIENLHESKVIEGRLVFRRTGHGSSAAPEIPFSVAAQEVLTFPDIVAEFDETGAGSLDVVVTSGPLPQVSAHLFNDGGGAGTHGLQQAAIDPASSEIWCWGQPDFPGSSVLRSGVSGFLITPESPPEARFNIGVRTLSAGAAIVAELRDRDGHLLHTATRSYAPNHFEQVSAEEFLGVPIGGTQSIRLSVTKGLAIVYGVATDNITNDPSMQHVRADIYDSSTGPRSFPGAERFVLRILPVIGPPREAAGSVWRTSVQLFNPHPTPIEGTLRFHRAHTAPSEADASMAYTLASGQIAAFSDVAGAMGVSGPGHIAFRPSNANLLGMPVIVARAHSGIASEGTRGSMVEAVDPYTWGYNACGTPNDVPYPGPILTRNTYGYLDPPAPGERLTIGFVVIPAAEEDAYLPESSSFTAVLKNPDGTSVASVTRTHPSTWSEELTAEELFASAINPDQAITFFGESGNVLIYGVTTDVQSGDIRVEYVRPLRIDRHAVIP
jgi:hypothetical protein